MLSSIPFITVTIKLQSFEYPVERDENAYLIKRLLKQAKSTNNHVDCSKQFSADRPLQNKQCMYSCKTSNHFDMRFL